MKLSADGAVVVTLNDATTFGLFMADGSLRVSNTYTSMYGAYDPTGGLRVTTHNGTALGLYDPTGALWVTDATADGQQGPLNRYGGYRLSGYVASVVYSGTQWDPAKRGSVTISDSGRVLTPTVSGTMACCLSIAPLQSNRNTYWEIEFISTAGQTSIVTGIGSSTINLNGFVGGDTQGVGVALDTGGWYTNGGQGGTIADGPVAVGARLRFAYEPSGNQFFVHEGAGTMNVSTGGISVAALGATRYIAGNTLTTGDSLRLYTEPAQWLYSAPATYNAIVNTP